MRAYPRWMVGVVSLWGLSRSVAAAPSAALSGSVQQFRLGVAQVAVPLTAGHYAGPAGLFVSATADSLHSALSAAGWRPVSHAPAAGASSAYCRKTEHAVGAAAGDRVLAWEVADNDDGPGKVWFVRLVHDESAPKVGAARPDSELSLNAIFLSGTSRLGLARPVRGGGRPLAWVRLRHAAGELRIAPAQPGDVEPDGAGGAEGGATELGVQVAACMQPPEPSAALVPAPAAGPACEAHDALPLHPLLADKIAGSVVWHNASDKKQVALTFDACSTFAIGRFNPRVVAALRAEQVPATLFVGGHWAEMYPDVLEELAQDPLFEIGNHTYSHPHMRELSAEGRRQELLWTQELIFERTGKVPRLFRPPYGEVDDALIQAAAKAGLYTIEYDLPAGDADDHVTTARLAGWVIGRSNPGSIVVMHMCRPNNHTAEALPHIVRRLRAQGYRFCQVGDMLFNEGKQCR